MLLFQKYVMTTDFTYTFPSIRGVQAGREFYISMCPLRLLSKIFVFDDEELMPELRAQRSLNRTRIPEMARYILGNSDTYTFSAITASIDGEVQFEPINDSSPVNFRMGALKISMDAKFIVNDGQHRRAAIEQALQIKPELGDETIGVVFFVDRGLERCQQMFADLNRYAVKTSASLSILYDHRSVAGNVAKHLSLTSTVFRNLIETERSSLSARSRKLFTLSALHFAIIEFLHESEFDDFQSAIKKCNEFWMLVGEQIPEWSYVRESKMSAGEVRRDFIHSHAIVLQSLGRVGRAIYELENPNIPKILTKLKDIDWSRRNLNTWEGRAMVGGTMSKSGKNIVLTSNEIKRVLGLPLTDDETATESMLQTSRAPN
jgi:DNA sulfur modification protein DndB